MASSLNGPAAQPPTRELTDAIKLLVEKLAPAKKEAAAAAPAQTGLQQVGAAFSQIAGAAGAVVGVLQEVVSTTKTFVAALQPALVQQFDQAFRDLQATLGVAFTGIFEQGIALFQRMGAAFAPIMQQLKPVVDQLAGAVVNILGTFAQVNASALSGLLPIVKVLGTVLSAALAVLRPFVAVIGTAVTAALAPLTVLFEVLNAVLAPFARIGEALFGGLAAVVQAVTDVIRVLAETVGAAIANVLSVGDVKDAVKEVTDTFTRLRNSVIIAAARLALLAGSVDFVKRQIALLSATGEKAAGPTTIKTLEQIGKDLALASVNAAGAAGEEANPNAEVVKRLEDMIAANEKNADSIVSGISRAVGGDRAGNAVKVTEGFFSSPLGWAVSPGAALVVTGLGQLGSRR